MWWPSLARAGAEQGDARAAPFEQANPAASPIEMPARSASQGRHGVGEISSSACEAVQRHAAQAVRAADHGGVAQPGADQVRGVHEGAGAAGAGGGDTVSAGPCSPGRRATNRASEYRSCVRR